MRKFSFTYRTAKVWKSLPENIVLAPSVDALERRLDKYWIDQPIKYQYEAEYVYHGIGAEEDSEDQDSGTTATNDGD